MGDLLQFLCFNNETVCSIHLLFHITSVWEMCAYNHVLSKLKACVEAERLDNQDDLADSILWYEYSCGRGRSFQCLILLVRRGMAKTCLKNFFIICFCALVGASLHHLVR